MLPDIPPRDDAARLQDLRHRLGNSFQLLQAIVQRRYRRATNPLVRQELGLMLQAVTAIGELQRSLDSGGRVDFADHLIIVSRQWRQLLRERRIDLVLNVMSVEAPESTASTLSLIAHELIANCIEHAFPDGRPGRVNLSLLIDEKGFVELSVADNGRGLAGMARPPRGGLRLVRGLARRIGGSFTLQSAGGTVASVWFPLPANED